MAPSTRSAVYSYGTVYQVCLYSYGTVVRAVVRAVLRAVVRAVLGAVVLFCVRLCCCACLLLYVRAVVHAHRCARRCVCVRVHTRLELLLLANLHSAVEAQKVRMVQMCACEHIRMRKHTYVRAWVDARMAVYAHTHAHLHR